MIFSINASVIVESVYLGFGTHRGHHDPISVSGWRSVMDLWAGVDSNGPVLAGTRRPAPVEMPGVMPVIHTRP